LWFDPARYFVGNEWVPAEGGDRLALSDPSCGEQIGEIVRGGAADVDRAVASARSALDGPWGRITAPEHGRVLFRLGQLGLENAEALALSCQHPRVIAAQQHHMKQAFQQFIIC
jgi:aldehyde dehydrogenase (NAD+)